MIDLIAWLLVALALGLGVPAEPKPAPPPSPNPAWLATDQIVLVP